MTRDNDWSTMQNSSHHDMQVDSLGAFSARNPLDSLAVAAPGRTRCVNAENPTAARHCGHCGQCAWTVAQGQPVHSNRESGGERHTDGRGWPGRDPPYLDDRH